MGMLSNVQAPSAAVPGKYVGLSVDVEGGYDIGGATYHLTWVGDAPDMPNTVVLVLPGTWFGDPVTHFFKFKMPDRVVRFRVEIKEKSALLEWLNRSDQTPYYTITPGTEEHDPNKPPGEWFEKIAKWFGEMGSTLLWIVVAFTALVVIGYVVKKKGASKPSRP